MRKIIEVTYKIQMSETQFSFYPRYFQSSVHVWSIILESVIWVSYIDKYIWWNHDCDIVELHFFYKHSEHDFDS